MVGGWAEWIENLPLFDRVIEEGLTTRDELDAMLRGDAGVGGAARHAGGDRRMQGGWRGRGDAPDDGATQNRKALYNYRGGLTAAIA